MIVGREAIQMLLSAWRRDLPADQKSESLEKAMGNYCHAIMNSAALLYVQ
jgi:hypothetical protein